MTGDLNADCTHPRARHRHGTYACAVRDRCDCEPCKQARRRTAKQDAHRRDRGLSTLVDATPARLHAQRLADAGMGRAEIARLADIDVVSITRLLRGDMATMRRDRSTRILSVTLRPVTEQALGLVPACGIIRRAEALACLGWSAIEVLRRAHLGVHVLETARHTGMCYASTRAAIAAVYDELWDQWPPETSSTIRTRTIAARRGYAPAMAWDDDDLDNPDAHPATPGRHVPFSRRAARLEDVRELLAYGEHPAMIAQRIGVKVDTLAQTLRRHAPEVATPFVTLAARERKAS